MKKIVYPIVCCLSMIMLQPARSQNNSPAYFFQRIDVSNYRGAPFSLECWFFAEREDNNSGSALLTSTFGQGNKQLGYSLGKLSMEGFKPGEWNRLTLTDKIDKQADILAIGALYSGKAKFMYDDLKLVIKGKNGQTDTLLKNPGFEDADLAAWKFSGTPEGAALSLTGQLSHSGRQALCIDASGIATTGYGNNTAAGQYVDINGNRIYYEIYGEGAPLLLLHGAGGSIQSFSRQIPELSKHFKVIAVDTRGHGRSTADTTTLRYELYADDMYQLLNKLNLDQVNVLGWSDGGNTGLILSMQHPEKVRKLAVTGANLYNNETSVYEWVNDTLRNQIRALEQLHTKEAAFEARVKHCLLTQPNIDPSSLKAIKCPVLVMAGKKDVIKEAHTKLIAGSIAASKLVIFKDASHEVPVEAPAQFNKTVLAFFTEQ